MTAAEKQVMKSASDRLSIGQHKVRCPFCQNERRKNKHDKPLSINKDSSGVRYHCWHCDTQGGWMDNNELDFDFSGPQLTSDAPPSKDTVSYLESRGITRSIIEKFTISGTYRFNGHPVNAVGFPYRSGTGIKWRSADGDKKFSQQNICEDFFLLETYKSGNSILICEGEIDALAWLSAGLPDDVTVMSVPNGAPSKLKDGKIDPSEDGRFKYIWRAKAQISQAPRVYLNLDNDHPGHVLAEEISRRVGRAKVWETKLGDHKDAAAAIKAEGPEYLLRALHSSVPMPVIGLVTVDDIQESVDDLYVHGQMYGAKVGIKGVDRLFCIPTGMLTVVTGFPGSGKSDLIDQFCVNLARDYGWRTIFCSFEKPPSLHAAQLAQKLTSKAFFKAENGVERMTKDEMEASLEWIRDNFQFMDATKGGPTDIDGILSVASAAVMRMGCRVLVIDPYNYITVDRSGLETDAISETLTKIQQWARSHDAHVFFIAHPAKPSDRGRGKYVCTGLDVAKSMAWYAKADIGITAWRSENNDSELHAWKVRWSWMGTPGHTKLCHNPTSSTWVGCDNGIPEDYDWSF